MQLAVFHFQVLFIIFLNSEMDVLLNIFLKILNTDAQ